MTPGSRFHSVLTLACEPSAVRYARGHADAVLRDWCLPEEEAYDALTVVAELASNAVRHAGAEAQPFTPGHGQPRALCCQLSLWLANGRLRISMYDESDQPPVLRPRSTDTENGRGLQLVAGLSRDVWGYQLSAPAHGKTVWAELPVAAATSPARGSATAGSEAVGA
jgi:anti-sigma regulatory factor (Ser/Thr protein kinase)